MAVSSVIVDLYIVEVLTIQSTTQAMTQLEMLRAWNPSKDVEGREIYIYIHCIYIYIHITDLLRF